MSPPRVATSPGPSETPQKRPHKKSRAGCKTCKTRKVKCDEAKPECAKCQRFGVPCDFLPQSEWESRQAAGGPEPQQSAGETRPRGRPRRDWKQWAAGLPEQSRSVRTSSSPTRASPGFDPPVQEPEVTTASAPAVVPASLSAVSLFVSAGRPLDALNVDDFLVFHHYLTVTVPTIGTPHVWRNGVPLLAERHPSVLHGMLAVAAYHMARSRVLQRPKFLSIAERHYAAAIRETTLMMANMSIENCQAVYASATLVSFTAFAKGPRPGDLILVAHDGLVPWMSLLRGVRMVMLTYTSSVVLSGILDPKGDGHSWPHGCKCPPDDETPRGRRFELNYPGWDWRESLQRFSEAAASSLPPDKLAYIQPQITALLGCYESFVQDRPGKNGTDTVAMDFISVMAWVFSLEDSFTDALGAREVPALIVLGYFGVLLRAIKGYWWLDGWGDHVLKQLQEILGQDYVEWLPVV